MEEDKRRLERLIQTDFENPALHIMYAKLLMNIGNDPLLLKRVTFLAETKHGLVYQDSEVALTKDGAFSAIADMIAYYIEATEPCCALAEDQGINDPTFLELFTNLKNNSGENPAEALIDYITRVYPRKYGDRITYSYEISNARVYP